MSHSCVACPSCQTAFVTRTHSIDQTASPYRSSLETDTHPAARDTPRLDTSQSCSAHIDISSFPAEGSTCSDEERARVSAASAAPLNWFMCFNKNFLEKSSSSVPPGGLHLSHKISRQSENITGLLRSCAAATKTNTCTGDEQHRCVYLRERIESWSWCMWKVLVSCCFLARLTSLSHAHTHTDVRYNGLLTVTTADTHIYIMRVQSPPVKNYFWLSGFSTRLLALPRNKLP